MLCSIGHWISHREVRICTATTSHLLLTFVNHALFYMALYKDQGPVWWCLDLDSFMLLVGWPTPTWTAGTASFLLGGVSICTSGIWFLKEVFCCCCFQACHCHWRVLRSKPGNSRCLSGVSPGHKHHHVDLFFPLMLNKSDSFCY